MQMLTAAGQCMWPHALPPSPAVLLQAPHVAVVSTALLSSTCLIGLRVSHSAGAQVGGLSAQPGRQRPQGLGPQPPCTSQL